MKVRAKRIGNQVYSGYYGQPTTDKRKSTKGRERPDSSDGYIGRRIRPGEVFDIPDEPVNQKTGMPMAFSSEWMEPVDPVKPKKPAAAAA